MKKLNIGVAVLVVFLAGCAANKVTEDKYSGFLSNYSQLEQSDIYPETKLYVAPNVDFSNYKSVMIDKVKILDPDGLERPNNTLLVSIATAYENELKTSFRKKGYGIVGKPELGVIRIQAAITSVYGSYDDLKAYQYIPISAAITGAMRATGTTQKNARVMMEAKVTDAKSGQLLASVIDLQKGKALESSDSKVALDDVMPVLQQWALRFANALARLQNK
ncbi:MAG: DUF3313 domain-containing protein [Cycloclasticus sp.]|nr:DUF3313 domain-containing protein [Cycloclasticus sp.]